MEPIAPAPRLDTLDGKTVAIVGGSFMANVTHPELRRLLLAEFPTAKPYVLSEIGSAGPYPRPGVVRREKDAFQRKLRELGVDAVVSGNGGCGLCTPKETGSCVAPAAASSSTPPEVPRTGPAPDSGAAGPAPGHGFAAAPPPAGFPTVWAKSANRVGGSARAAAISSGRSDPRNTVRSPAAAQCR